MSWKLVKLGSLLTQSKVPSEDTDANRRIRVKLNVGGVEKRPVSTEVEGATKYYIRKAGQFIFGTQNFHKGAFGVVPPELDGFETSSDIPSFDVSTDCRPEWIFFYFKAGDRYKELEKLARGVGSKRIHPNQLYDLLIPVPPVAKQLEIIEEVQASASRQRQIAEELNQQQANLTQLRQALLREAMQGRLLPQDPRDEPAAALLQQLQAAKAKLGKAGKRLAAPLFTEEAEAVEGPFAIPASWVWCMLGDISDNVEYGTSEKASLDIKGIPVLRMNNIQNGEVLVDNLKYLPKDAPDLPKLFLQKNDLLFNRTNSAELVGKAGIYKGESNQMTFASYLIRVQFSIVDTAYFTNYYINSLLCRASEIEPFVIQQNGQANFNGTKLKEIRMPLPPLAEQQRIVAKLTQLLTHCDALEQRIAESRRLAGQLLQTALREALAGPGGAVVAAEPSERKRRPAPAVGMTGDLFAEEE